MLRFFYIGIGGAVGALLRYWLSGVTHRVFNSGFPWGTLSVNLIGSLLIGFLWGIFESASVSQNIRLFIFIGLLGSFTTFSTFSIENFHLIRDGEFSYFLINAGGSLVFGVLLAFTGYFISRHALNTI